MLLPLSLVMLAASGPAAEASPPVTVPSVVVTAPSAATAQQQFDRKVQSVVRSLAVAAPNAQLSRWSRPICVRVAGMSVEQGTALMRRLNSVAKDLGLLLDRPGCLPNIDVLLTEDPRGLIEDLEKKDYPFVAFAQDEYRVDGMALPIKGGSHATQGVDRALYERFLASAEPVRVWHTEAWRKTDGRPGSEPDPDGRAGFSRVSTTGADEVFCVLVVIDANQLKDLQFEQLADYIVLQTFTRPDPKQQPQAPSILTLFADRKAGRPSPPGLTEWDRGFLKGLYAARGNTGAGQQRNEIERALRAELNKPEASKAP